MAEQELCRREPDAACTAYNYHPLAIVTSHQKPPARRAGYLFAIYELGIKIYGMSASRNLELKDSKITKTRGRPRTFDEREAVRKAMRIFWAKGYDAVTIDDLVDGMGVGRPSLYAVFGDKAAIFKRSLETYAEEQRAGALKALQSPEGVRDSIAALIVYAVKSSTTKGLPGGCLLGCVAPVVDDPDVRDFLVRANAQTVSVVEQRLRRAIDAGQLPSDFPVAVRARQVIDLTTGLATRARLGVPRAQLLTDAEQAATLVLGSDVTSVGRSTDDAGRHARRVRR